MNLARLLSFLLAFVATCALVWVLERPLQVGDNTLPPLGGFFNPFAGFWRNAEPAVAVPGQKADIRLPGLKNEVQVVYDELLVPHIFAQNAEDAMRAQGYVVAQHRLWQMDMTARSASGTLSEVLGPRTLEIDRLTRRQGMGLAAQNTLAVWEKSPENKALLDAFTAGANAWLAQMPPADWPVEFKLLNYAPTEWSNLKSALVFAAMARNLSFREDDFAATTTLAQIGAADFNYLFPEWNPTVNPVVPDLGQWKNWPKNPAPAAAMPAELPASTSFFEPMPDPESGDPTHDGSNNWAVAAQKSASGHPMLANDPHLGLTLPSFWFQVQLHTPEVNCYGVTLPGVPGIVIGFNENIAWGVTNGGHDVVDWYKIQWTDASRTAYLLDGQAIKADLRIEEIKVKNRPTLLDTVRYTTWGPVTHDHKPGHPYRDCAMRWVAHNAEGADQISTFRGLNTGKTLADYQKALAGFASPAQNFVFAARSGDIAMQVQGKFPLRAPGQGRTVQDGSQSANDWPGFVPQEHLPAMQNPLRGFVASANQHSVPPSYPYYLPGSYADWRNIRINKRLADAQNATLDSMKALQMDNFSARAAAALPVMLRLLDRSNLNSTEQKHAAELENWRFNYEKDLAAPALFEAWFDSCYARTWDEFFALRAKGMDVLTPEAWRFVFIMERDPSNKFFDHAATPDVRETAQQIVTETFKTLSAKAALAAPGDWAWGKFRGLKINHLAYIAAFGRKDILTGGHRTAPNAQTSNHGPSWRMVVEMSDPVRAQGIYPGGQSGNPGSPFYDNMIEAWAAGQYFDLKFLRAPTELAAPLRTQVFR